MDLTPQEALLFAICVMPALTCVVCIFACELSIQRRENDTRRYPRYGQSDDMRDNGKFSVKRRYDDNET